MHSPDLRATLVQRMLSPNAIPIRALARECGVPQSTLWQWRFEALQSSSALETPMPSAASTPDFTPAQKLELLLQASALPQDQLGAFLRSKGIQEAQLLAWRQDALLGLSPARPSSQAADLRRLQAELQRKEQALAEAAALLLLQKKTSLLWADAESTSHKKNGFGS